MGKSKRHKKKSASKNSSVDKAALRKSIQRALPATRPPSAVTSDNPGTRPPGQRFYDLPYSAPAPRMVNPELGLHNLVARAGHNAAYEIDVTLLDAPDHRLIRSGVLLAHRVLEGRGEWFMTAPDWQPLLPKDRIELMGHSDLPEELADLIRPLRRRATLGPVAALNCDRREFALRDDHGATMALLRDDKVTVRRAGLTTARYREVMITPIGEGLNDEQVTWLDRALVQAGATQVPRFPRLVTRLGAPATGPTDVPEPIPFEAAAPFKRFVSQLMARRLREIVKADLAIRGGDLNAVSTLADQADGLRVELKGLSSLLDPEWVEDVYDELGWITVGNGANGTDDRDRLSSRLRSERYLTLLERLVSAVRTPKLAEGRTASAGDVLTELVTAAVARLRRTADSIEIDSPDQEWDEAWQEIRRLQWVLEVARPARPDPDELVEELAEPARLLTQVRQDLLAESDIVERIADLTAAEAFESGREFERETGKARRTRRDFVKTWSKVTKKLDA